MQVIRWLPVAVLIVVTGCGSDVVLDAESAADPYDGPMHVDVADEDDPDVTKRSGAAGMALECAGRPSNGNAGDYDDSGLATVRGDAEEALEGWMDEEGSVYGGLPTRGYRVERKDDGRVLYSFDVGGETKAAVIVANGIRDWEDDTGWGVESWAMCDPSEFPAEITDELDIAVWEDADGRRVPTYEVSSHQGAEHCDWEDITFLNFGEGRATRQFVRDASGEFETLKTTYAANAELPADAIDTGWRRDGLHLWLADDGSAAYLVALDDPTDVERWPAAGEPILCA